MSLQSVLPFVLDFLPRKPIILEESPAQLSSDAGLLVVREFDERIRFTRQIAAALHDPRFTASISHDLLSMVRQRMYGILADYEDQDDHDTLRSDPVFKLIADRSPDDDDLASQPTLSRFENAVSIPDLWKLRDVLVDQFIQSFDAPPAHLTLDLDAFDDPTHGQQQLTLFHGHYDQYQYFPIIITCAENNLVLLVGLRHGTCPTTLGVDDDLRYLLERFRQQWPDVQVHVRADSGFATPTMYEVCEELRLTYTFGMGMHKKLQKISEDLLEQAQTQYQQTGAKARLFQGQRYRGTKWTRERYVVIKAEVHAEGTNRRAVVTNRPGAATLPQAIYDEYAQRGESENRNKELKCGLHADRLSDHRFMANFFRLYLHTATLNLLTLLKRTVARDYTPAELGLYTELPAEALPERPRKQYDNRRRRADPLGAGHPATWRTRLIKVAAAVTVSARRVVVQLSRSWPHLRHLAAVARQILSLPPAPT